MKNNLKFILFTPLLLVFSFCSSEPTQEEIQAQIDAAVAQAVEEALANTSTVESTTTTTVLPELNLDGSYWGLYDNGTWATAPSSQKPENFEWAWDIFKQYPSIEFTIEDFHEDSTLIGSLVNFDCSFNRISKTEEHKAAFGVDKNTIEYYDTYLEWAEDNYASLPEETVLTISKIMRGVWTCDYEYLESISTEFLDFYMIKFLEKSIQEKYEELFQETYPDFTQFAEYSASIEQKYDDDNAYDDKYTYRLGALLYIGPDPDPEYLEVNGSCYDPTVRKYSWPQWKDPNEMSEIEIAKWSMFDNGWVKSIINGTRFNTQYPKRLSIASTGIWTKYKSVGDSGPSGFGRSYAEICLSPKEREIILKTKSAISSDTAIVGNVNTSLRGFTLYKQDYTTMFKDVRIEIGTDFDSFIIESERTIQNNFLPGPYSIARGISIRLYEGEYEIPSDFKDHLVVYPDIRAYNILNSDRSTWVTNWNRADFITADGSNLAAKFGASNGSYFFVLKIEPGATFRSYRTANPPSIVIEVEK